MDKVHFIIFSPSGSGNKQFKIAKKLLNSLIFLFIIGVISLGYVIPDYIILKSNYLKDCSIRAKVESQENELITQRKQISIFAKEINELKQRVVYLNNFEKKVRNVANLDTTNNDVFGVGGTIPEDLDTNLSFKEQHSDLIREMHSQTDQIKTAAIFQERRFEMLLEDIEEKKDLLESTPSINPTKGWISSSFGRRVSPFTGRREFHKGIDIANHIGTKIISPASGLVTYVGKRGGYGKMITIDHGHGMLTHFGHLKKALVGEGDIVKRGDVIALMGNTGRSTGPHLHYEVRLNGVPVNPEKYILN